MKILQGYRNLLKRYYEQTEATKLVFMFNLKVGMSLLSCESQNLQSFKAEVADATKNAISSLNVNSIQPSNHNDQCEVESQVIEGLVKQLKSQAVASGRLDPNDLVQSELDSYFVCNLC